MEELIKKAGILVEALPYIQKLNGKTVVIKYGGNAMISEELKNKVMEDITLLKFIGLHPVLVHGGGPDISETLTRFGIQSEFVNGLRVTDDETMRVAQMVLMGKTNKEIVSLISQKGGKALGLSGIDGELIECEKQYANVDGKIVDSVTEKLCAYALILKKRLYIQLFDLIARNAYNAFYYTVVIDKCVFKCG